MLGSTYLYINMCILYSCVTIRACHYEAPNRAYNNNLYVYVYTYVCIYMYACTEAFICRFYSSVIPFKTHAPSTT